VPISQILPDGKVRIYSNTTGQVLDVMPEELPKYNPKLVGEYLKKQDEQKQVLSAQKMLESGQEPTAYPEGVRAQAQTKLVQSGKTTGNTKAQKAKSDIIDVAKQMQTVMANKGQYDEKGYKDAINSLASSLILKKKEAENLGAALSGNELAILSGQTPVTQTIGASFPQRVGAFFTGKEPVQHGEVVEDEETMKNKLALLVAGMEGKKITPEMLASTRGGGGQKSNLLNNAGGDLKNIANGLLGIPAGYVQAALHGEDPRRHTGKLAMAGLKGAVQEYNDALGHPLEGGDIVGRIGQHAFEHPVNTALDVVPFAGAAMKGLRGAGAASMAGQAGEEMAAVQNAARTTVATNPVQKSAVGVSEVLGGGGSKEYIARTATNADALPQRQVLMDEGVLMHPTETGRIKATATAISHYGKQLEDVYAKSPDNFTGTDIQKLVTDGLKGQGYDPKAIAFIKRYISQQGGFDLEKGDNVITPHEAWKSAQLLEQAPPKMLKNPESSHAYKQLSQDAARILRQALREKIPQTTDINARYSALRDYMDNGLQDPNGVHNVSRSGIVGTVRKGTADPLVNAAYKLVRDKRFKQGQFVPRNSSQASR
jgi:hypothetical protein